MKPVNEMVDQLVRAIRFICKKQNVSVSQMEADLGFSPGLISRWNKTKTSPSFDKIAAIMEYLGVTYDELMSSNIPEQSANTTFIHPKDKELCDKLRLESESGRRKWFELRKDGPFHVTIESIFPDWTEFHFHIVYYTAFKDGFFILTLQYEIQDTQLNMKAELFSLAEDGLDPRHIHDDDLNAMKILKCVDHDLYMDLVSQKTESMEDDFLAS